MKYSPYHPLPPLQWAQTASHPERPLSPSIYFHHWSPPPGLTKPDHTRSASLSSLGPQSEPRPYVTASNGTGGQPSVLSPSSEPPLKRQSTWSEAEDALIMTLRGGGMKWEEISKKLSGRSAIACRLHYQAYLERRLPAPVEPQASPSIFSHHWEPPVPQDSSRGRSLHRRDSNASLLSERLSEAGRYHVQEAASRAGTPNGSRTQSPFRAESPYYDQNKYPSQGHSSPFETVNPSDIDSWRSGVLPTPPTLRRLPGPITPSNYGFLSETEIDSNTDDYIRHQNLNRRSPPELSRTMTDTYADELYNPDPAVSRRTNLGKKVCANGDCVLRFDTRAELRKHVLEGPHWCSRENLSSGKRCNAFFQQLSELRRHLITVHNTLKRKYRCRYCTDVKCFSRNDALLRHHRVCHPDSAKLNEKLRGSVSESLEAGIPTIPPALPEQNDSIFTPLTTPASIQLPQRYPFVPPPRREPLDASKLPPHPPAEVPSVECDQNSNLYASDEGNTQHNIQDWTSFPCTYPGCTLPSFNTLDGLIKHRLELHHYDKESPSTAGPVTQSSNPITHSTEPMAGGETTTDRTKNTFNSVTCSICKTVVETPSKLRKHMRRHDRPYACTNKHCEKAFGSKYDWRRHECFQHNDLSVFRCDTRIPTSSGAVEVCATVTSTKHDYQRHLLEQHQQSLLLGAEHFEAKARACLVGWDTDHLSFWCGFCKAVVLVRCQNFKVRNERFDHIAHHFIAESKRIYSWVPIDQRIAVP